MSRARHSIFGDYIRLGLKQSEEALGKAVAASTARTEAITEQYKGRRVTLGASPPDARAEAEKRVIEAARRLVAPGVIWHTGMMYDLLKAVEALEQVEGENSAKLYGGSPSVTVAGKASGSFTWKEGPYSPMIQDTTQRHKLKTEQLTAEVLKAVKDKFDAQEMIGAAMAEDSLKAAWEALEAHVEGEE